MSFLRRGLALVCVMFSMASTATAQQTIVTGTVRTTTGEPVRGAFVGIVGQPMVSATNDAGIYRLTLPATATGEVSIQVLNIGFKPTAFRVRANAGLVRQDVTLVEEAISLKEVVVTGTAGRQERRAQAAVVAKVDAARVAQIAPVHNLQTLLQSRVPGLHIAEGSGSVGSAPRIRLRGVSSISLSNEPLVFIDGVRSDSRSTAIYGLSGQSYSRLNDMSPDDVESIEVVKGPAAATLYGADASAGVINIITKRGR